MDAVAIVVRNSHCCFDCPSRVGNTSVFVAKLPDGVVDNRSVRDKIGTSLSTDHECHNRKDRLCSGPAQYRGNAPKDEGTFTPETLERDLNEKLDILGF